MHVTLKKKKSLGSHMTSNLCTNCKAKGIKYLIKTGLEVLQKYGENQGRKGFARKVKVLVQRQKREDGNYQDPDLMIKSKKKRKKKLSQRIFCTCDKKRNWKGVGQGGS